MQIRAFYILTFIFFVYNTSAQSITNKHISLNTENKNFKQIIEYMEKNYGLSFSYSDDILPKHKLPLQKFEKLELTELLNKLFVSHGINYTTKNNKIVLFLNKKPPLFTISGFIEQEKGLENLIGAVLYSKKEKSVGISNAYGYYTLKLSAGFHNLQISCLGYEGENVPIYVWGNKKINFKLTQKSYNVEEVLVKTPSKEKEFLESHTKKNIHLDIETLKQLPNFFGENDALRNLSLIPGVQTNELSTGSIFVRGGTTEQTLFLMDEATVYNPTHFFGFFSVFNPDVVKHISIYKSELPLNESGALSSVIDVRLREGNYKQWKASGGVGLISARAAIEGPIVKDKSSVLIAFRRSFVDRLFKIISSDKAMKKLRFLFYDANLKFNYRINNKNRLFLSGYTGGDSFSQFNTIERRNSLATLRWNHIYGENMFSNTSVIYSTNSYNQILKQNDEEIHWKSTIYNLKIKTDFSYHLNKYTRFKYGYSSSIFNVEPYSYTAISERDNKHEEKALIEQLWLNSVYFNQESLLYGLININFGLRLSHIYNSPFLNRENKYKGFKFEPTVSLGYIIDKKNRVKLSYNHREQPMHQLYINRIGISVNRWLPASTRFQPQTSNNFSVGFYSSKFKNITLSANLYYRNMDNLIETMQETRILYSNEPEKYFYYSSAKIYGMEASIVYYTTKYKAMISYDYNNAMWKTMGINNNKPYPASHTRKHNFSISGIWKINKRLTLSAAWVWASGNPYTAATGKYEIDGKVYIKYDKDKVNQWNLPDYHRLDLSLDIKGKNNDKKRWKSFWNLSVYNVYFHKNILGVSYFSVSANRAFDIRKQDDELVQSLNPQFFYLYLFVPSISYRFNF